MHDDDGIARPSRRQLDGVVSRVRLSLLAFSPSQDSLIDLFTGEEAETWATQAVCEHLNKKLDGDKAGRAMRLRDFTLAARALSGRASAGERAKPFAKAAAPALARCLLMDARRTGRSLVASRRRRIGYYVWGLRESVLSSRAS